MTQEQENFYKHSSLLVDNTRDAFIDLLEFQLQQQGKTLQQFITQYQHQIYHLCFNKYPCCQCLPNTPRYTAGSRVIYPPQLDLLLDRSAGKLPCHIPGSPSAPNCCSPVNTSLTVKELDITLLRVLIEHFGIVQYGSPESTAVEDLTRIRNQSFAHVSQGSMTNNDFTKSVAKIEKSLLVLAKFCGKEQSIMQKFTEVCQQPISTRLHHQLQKQLTQEAQMDEKIEHFSDTLKNIEQILKSSQNVEQSKKRKLEETSDYFVRKFKDIDIIEGHDARFECEIIENIDSCNWIKDNVLLENPEKYNITKRGKKCTLEIVNCGLKDDGVYTVDVNNKKRDVCLYVKGFFTKTERNRTMMEGDRMKMTCEVIEDKQPGQWFKDGTELQACEKYFIEVIGRSHRLSIDNLQLWDTGQYSVDINNRKRVWSVTVEGYFTEDLNTNPCREGETATLYCELIEENNSLQWFKDGHEITESDRYRINKEGRQHRLTIQHVKLEDKGEYSVLVKNCRRQTFLEVEAYFTEDLRSNPCREGNTATIYCRLIEENNSLRWFKDGIEIKCETDRYRIDIEGRQHILTIPMVKLEDKGEYSVQVKNCKRQVILNVKGYFTEDLNTNPCREGDTATLYCELIEENNSLQWCKDGHEVIESDRYRILKEGRRHRLTIQHVKLEDKGEYSVMVKNCRRQTRLEVEAYFTEDLRTDLCREGEIATMYCRLIEENNSLRWFKDGHEIKCETNRYRIDIEGREHRLTIPVVDEKDKGEYSVHVKNCKRQIFLNVEGYFTKPLTLVRSLNEQNEIDGGDGVKLKEGEKGLCLECDVKEPDQSATWLKDGNSLRNGIQNKVEGATHKLYIPEVLLDDSGIYTVCINNKNRKIKIMVEENIDEIKQTIQSKTEKSRYIRVIIIGKNGVGKTSLLRRLLNEGIEDVKSTDGVDIVTHRCKINMNGEWKIEKEGNAKREMMARIRQAYRHDKSQVVTGERRHSDPEDFDTSITEPLNVASTETNEEKDDEVTDSLGTESEPKIGEEKGNIVTSTTETESKPGDEHTDISISTKSDSKKDESTARKIRNQVTHIISEKVKEELNTFLDDLENSEIGHEPYIECRFWDFAGQKDYYATHQIFLNPHVLCLLVVDIMTDIKKIDTNLNFDDIGEYVDFWFDNIHTYRLTSPKVDKNQKYLDPPVLVVCTGIDKIKDQKQLGERKRKLLGQLLELFGKEQKGKHFRRMYCVSNTDPTVDDLNELRYAIFQNGHGLQMCSTDVPLKWIRLERSLDVIKETGCHILSMDDIMKLSSNCSIENRIEINQFLSHQHNVGNLIYFANVDEYVILSQQWLADAFRCLVSDSEKFGGTIGDWEDLTRKGKLTLELIEDLFKKVPELDFSTYKDHLLNVMEQFGVLTKSKTSTSDTNDYYIPCMISKTTSVDYLLKEFHATSDKNVRSPWLCLTFDFMPILLFNQIFIHYIRKYEACKADEDDIEQLAIYHGMGVFFLDSTKMQKLIVCFSRNSICLQLWQSELAKKGTYKTLLREIHEEVNRCISNYHMVISGLVKAKCSSGSETKTLGRISIKELERGDYYYCEEHHTKHKSNDILDTWFEDYYEEDLGVLGNIENDISMDKIHKRALKKCRSIIVNDLSLENEFWHKVIEQEIFTPLMLEYIQAKNPRSEKVRKLLDDLTRRGPYAYVKFLYCLDHSGHNHLADYIRGREAEIRKRNNPAVILEPRFLPSGQGNGTVYNPTDRSDHGHRQPLSHSASAEPLSQHNSVPNIFSSQTSPKLAASGTEVTSPSDVSLNNSSLPHQSSSEDIRMENEGDVIQSQQEQGPSSLPVNYVAKQQNSGSLRDRSKIYTMTSTPRGYVLIINNHFLRKPGDCLDHQTESDLYRRGAKKDQEMLQELFSTLGFHVDIKEDKTAQEMEQLLTEFSHYEGLLNVHSLIVVLMSHGNNEVILGTDCERRNIIDLVKLFNADRCPTMMNKPKMFIVNACRGDDIDCTVRLGGTQPVQDGIESDVTPVAFDRKQPANSDLVIAYSTFPGYASFRDPEQGSWFIQCLVEVFRERAHEEHVMDMLTEVNDRVSDLSENGMGYNQTPAPTTTLRYKWFLNPPSS